MISTGSKLFLGLTGLSVAAFVVYGATQNFGALGSVGLFFLICAAIGLAAAVVYHRDGDVSAMDMAAVQTAAAGSSPAGSSMWPLVSALGAGLLVVGIVTDKRYFVGGLAVLLVATLEWMVRNWADSATGDAAANTRARRMMAHPLELPLAGAAGLAAVIFGFSRAMLGTGKAVGPVIFGVAAALILGVGTLFVARPNLRKSLVSGVCALGGVAVLAGGVAFAATGQREELTKAREEDHYNSRGHLRECGAEIDEHADHKASGGVAAKSNTVASFTLTEAGVLEVDQIASSLDAPGTALTISKGTTVSVLFHNESEGEHRLRVFGGTTDVIGEDGQPVKNPSDETKNLTRAIEFCTRAIHDGKTQLLTIRMPKSSYGQPEPFYAEVPGVDGARVEVVVP